MRIAVCDDEEAQRKLIANYLQEWSAGRKKPVEVMTFSGGEDFLFQWEDDKGFDLLVLDIEMGAVNGVELAQKVREENEEIPILFITGYDTYMARGYEVAAIQYLLKPMYKDKLFAVMDKLLKGKKPEEKLTFQTEEGMLLINPSEIWFGEASGHYCILHTAKGEYQVRHSITDFGKMIDGRKEFVRCHRSFFVNLMHISAITKTEIVMDDGERLPISRSAAKAVNEAFIRNYGLAGKGKSEGEDGT